jgi:hypothetical protein
MTAYRLFKLNDRHEIIDTGLVSVHDLESDAVMAAAALARECHAVEIWLGPKMVARVGHPLAVRTKDSVATQRQPQSG